MDSTIVRLLACGMASSWHHVLGMRLEAGAFPGKGHQGGSYLGSYVLPRMVKGPGDISGREENSIRDRCGLASLTWGAFF